MKSFVALLCISMAVGAMAAGSSRSSGSSRNYGMAGCGLGSQVFSDKGMMGQTCASTTNGTFWNQFFAMSSGTSNCEATEDQIAQLEFVNGNLASLQKEIAQGDGETLVAFAEVLGCENVVYPVLAKTLKANHGAIFAQPGAVPVLEATLDAVQGDSELTSHCQKIG